MTIQQDSKDAQLNYRLNLRYYRFYYIKGHKFLNLKKWHDYRDISRMGVTHHPLHQFHHGLPLYCVSPSLAGGSPVLT